MLSHLTDFTPQARQNCLQRELAGPCTRSPEAAGLQSGAGTVSRAQPRPSWRTSTSAPSAVCSATKFPSCDNARWPLQSCLGNIFNREEAIKKPCRAAVAQGF